MSIGNVGATRFRLTGLASGLDTQSIIDGLMTIERNKVNSVYRKKTTAEWKLEAYTKLNTDLSDFSNKYMSALSSSNIMVASAYTSYKANYTANSAFTVSGSSGIIPGNYNVTKTEMADYARLTGSEHTTAINRSSTIEEVAAGLGITLTDDKLEFSINGTSFSFDKSETISGMMSEVSSSAANVKMYYSELTKSFGFSSSDMGSATKIEFASSDTGAEQLLGLTNGTIAQGKDASITINGKTVTKSSNNFTIDGMKFTLTGNYEATGTDTGYGITFSQDTQTVVDKVKAFIEDYNKLVEDLYKKVREEKFYDYYPLTEEEIDALDNEKDVENWTNKAKSGILRSDNTVMSLLSDLRQAAYSIVGETGMMAADIGITTSGKEGMLKLDEEKFTNALLDNPDKVAEVMTGRSTATDKTQQYAESGFVARINITMNNYRNSLRANQIQQQTEKIYDYESSILDIEAKLITKEEALWAKYSALETLMSSMNSQSDWLSSQLAYL